MRPWRRAGFGKRRGWPSSWLWLCAGPGKGVKRYNGWNFRSRGCAGSMGLAIGDLGGQCLGLLDPAHDELLGRQKSNELALLVGLAHCFGEIGGIAILELPDRIDPDGLQQAGILFPHSLDPHAVG